MTGRVAGSTVCRNVPSPSLSERLVALRPLIEHIARKQLRKNAQNDWVELDDLVQVGWMGAWRKAGRWDPNGDMAFNSWCGLHAEYEMRRYIRDHAPATRVMWERGELYHIDHLERPIAAGEGEPLTLADTLVAPDDGPDSDTVTSVQQALDRVYMPTTEYAALTMWIFDDMRQVEIAELLGFSQMHVSRLIRQALNRLEETPVLRAAA